MKRQLLLILLLMAGILSLVVAVRLIAEALVGRQGAPKPDCVEQPSTALSLKGAVVVTNDRGRRPFVCGVRERAALPSVVQCYEMRDGCTE